MGRNCYCCGVYTDEFVTVGCLHFAVCENCRNDICDFIMARRPKVRCENCKEVVEDLDCVYKSPSGSSFCSIDCVLSHYGITKELNDE